MALKLPLKNKDNFNWDVKIPEGSIPNEFKSAKEYHSHLYGLAYSLHHIIYISNNRQKIESKNINPLFNFSLTAIRKKFELNDGKKRGTSRIDFIKKTIDYFLYLKPDVFIDSLIASNKEFKQKLELLKDIESIINKHLSLNKKSVTKALKDKIKLKQNSESGVAVRSDSLPIINVIQHRNLVYKEIFENFFDIIWYKFYQPNLNDLIQRKNKIQSIVDSKKELLEIQTQIKKLMNMKQSIKDNIDILSVVLIPNILAYILDMSTAISKDIEDNNSFDFDKYTQENAVKIKLYFSTML